MFRRTATKVAALLLASSAAVGAAAQSPLTFPVASSAPVALYGDNITFEVYRSGSKIGLHTVTFAQAGTRVTVTANLRLRVNVLFFTAYRLDYSARELWQDGQPIEMTAETNDNGERKWVEARSIADDFIIRGSGGEIELDSWLFATNHWNRAQVESTVLLNSITGRTARVAVRALGSETIATAQGGVLAERFEYTGELRDTHVWYDYAGRWVKMSFKAKDGSWIDYRCVRCAADH